MKIKIHPAIASLLLVSIYIGILFLVSGCMAKEDKQPISTGEVLDHDSGKTDAEIIYLFSRQCVDGSETNCKIWLITDPQTKCQYIETTHGTVTRNYSDQVQVCGDPAYDGELHPNIQTDNFPIK